MNDIFIQAVSGITIQDTFQKSVSRIEPLALQTPYRQSVDPIFKEYLDPNSARRMNRILKRAVLTAKQVLAEGKCSMPDAIIAGTGLGCIEDTEKFLYAMVTKGEYCLPPTHFIQSTHNTISSQIAIVLGCHGYNNTHVQRGVSFESALLDASLFMRQEGVHSVLVGGYDEMTPSYFKMLNRLGYWREHLHHSLDIVHRPEKGTFSGEGAISLLLSNRPSSQTYCQIVANTLIYDKNFSSQTIQQFLCDHGVTLSQIDIFAFGMNGDVLNDHLYHQLADSLSVHNKISCFKPICGEFYTSTAFALMYYADVLRLGYLPEYASLQFQEIHHPQWILIYNHSANKQHSLTLLKK